MSTETNKAICRRMREQLYNEQHVDLVQEFFAEDIAEHIIGGAFQRTTLFFRAMYNTVR